MQRSHTRFILGLLLACLVLFPGQAAAVDDIVRLRIAPVLIEDEANPGETITRMVSVENLSGDFLPVQAFAADVYSIDETGKLGVEGSAGTSSAKDWFRFEQEMILDPGVERQVEVTIVIPKTAQPGGRYVSLFFNPLIDDAGSQDATKLTVQSQIGVLFFLTVRGDIVKTGEISKFEIPIISFGSSVPMRAALKNTGNVHLRPHAVVVVRNLFGLTSGEVRVEDFGSLSALPGKTRATSFNWDEPFPFGIYKAELIVNNGPGFRIVSTRWFIVWNVWLLVGTVLAGGFYGLYRFTNGKDARRRGRARKSISLRRR